MPIVVEFAGARDVRVGAGHLNWATVLTELKDYDGYLAVECRLRGEPAGAVRSIPAFLRGFEP